MQRPTDSLRADHALTSRGLEILAAIAGHVRQGGDLPAADVATVLRFLREFLLAVHLRKESEIVCPAVAMRGDDGAANLVGELLRMHEQVGELLQALVLLWEPVGDLTPAEQQGFAETTAALTALVARMQQLEERRLFPACDIAVPADDQLAWRAQFAELEREPDAAAVWCGRLEPLAGRWLG